MSGAVDAGGEVRIPIGAGAFIAATMLHAPLLERAIGVLYLPQTELHSHYFHARIADQFDTVFHYDRTRAVEPLERDPVWEAGDVPETFPSGV